MTCSMDYDSSDLLELGFDVVLDVLPGIEDLNHENRGEHHIAQASEIYMMARSWLYQQYGWQYIDRATGKINDVVFISMIIAGEFGDYKDLRPPDNPNIFYEAKEALSNQYYARYGVNRNISNIQCAGNCSTAEQIAWITDLQGLYATSFKDRIAKGEILLYLGDAQDVAKGYSYGPDTMWMWGNTNDLEKYGGVSFTTRSLYKEYTYFIVYEYENRLTR